MPIAQPNPVFFGIPVEIPSGQRSTIPGTPVILINVTNPSYTRKIVKVQVGCRVESKVELFEDGNLIGSGRTGPGASNFIFEFDPPLTLVPLKSLVLQATACLGTPVTDVEGYILAADFN